MAKEKYRDFEEIVESLIWPNQGLNSDSEESQRHSAIFTVLEALPTDAFDKLDNSIDFWQWFIPHKEMLGEVIPLVANIFPGKDQGALIQVPYAKVLYLSPDLEDVDFNIAVAVIAHELAHIVLGHPLMSNSPGDYDKNEDEAWALIEQWGFDEEARDYRGHRGNAEEGRGK